MWDRLITDCHVATMVAQPGNPLGLFPNAAIGVDGGRIVRVGKRTEMAGFRKEEMVFVIATTNFMESLDAALLRPGRFELTISIPAPGEDDHPRSKRPLDKVKSILE